MPAGKKILALAAFWGTVLCAPGWSQTGLTTIQDTLFTADGTRFNGTLTIQWSTFDVSNGNTIVQQRKTVPVVNGNLLVTLTPNATATPPANYYTVSYQSDGNQQFTETWTVPASSTPLTVRQVRTGGVLNTSNTTSASPNTSLPIQESDVTGLVSDLAVRTTKGAAFGSNAVAIVDNNGVLETAVGQVGDCVMVDGTTGPCGAPTFVDAETPAGTRGWRKRQPSRSPIRPAARSPRRCYRNGLYQTIGFDYSAYRLDYRHFAAAGAIPQPGDTLINRFLSRRPFAEEQERRSAARRFLPPSAPRLPPRFCATRRES